MSINSNAWFCYWIRWKVLSSFIFRRMQICTRKDKTENYINKELDSDSDDDEYLLIFVSLLQTYCGIYSSHIFFFYFFLLQISFYIYLLLIVLISVYHSHTNLLLYLVSRLGFFDNKLNRHIHLFFIYNKNIS